MSSIEGKYPTGSWDIRSPWNNTPAHPHPQFKCPVTGEVTVERPRLHAYDESVRTDVPFEASPESK